MLLQRANRPSWQFQYNGHYRAFIYRSRYGNLYRLNFLTNTVERFFGRDASGSEGWSTDNKTVRPIKVVMEKNL